MLLLLSLLSILLGVLVGGYLLGSVILFYRRHRVDPERSPWAGVTVLYVTIYAVLIGSLVGSMICFLLGLSALQ
jgi:hypothetical protein